MDEVTEREMRARWQEFKRKKPHWGEGDAADEEERFGWFCQLELLGVERVMSLLKKGHFSESLPPGNC